MIVRDAQDPDVPQIVELANALLATTAIEWTERPHTVEDRQLWLEQHRRSGDPVLVAARADAADAGRPGDRRAPIDGFACYGDFRDAQKWPGYRFTVEHTVHVRESAWGRGVGRQLMHALMARAREAGKRVMVGGIDSENKASIDFHARLGFVEVARMPNIGWKLDRWLTLVLMQRSLVDRELDAGA